jgi:hypothetical protein
MPSRRERRKGEDPVLRFSSRLIPLPTLALLLLCACDTFPAQQAIGAALAPDGRPEVLYVSCPGEAVERVQVVRPVDNPGGGDDVVLWAITRTAPRPIAQQSFVVGAAPPRRISRIRSPSPRASLDPPTCRDRDDGQSFGGRGSFPRGKPSYRQDPYRSWPVRDTNRFSSVGYVEMQYVNTRLSPECWR